MAPTGLFASQCLIVCDSCFTQLTFPPQLEHLDLVQVGCNTRSVHIASGFTSQSQHSKNVDESKLNHVVELWFILDGYCVSNLVRIEAYLPGNWCPYCCPVLGVLGHHGFSTEILTKTLQRWDDSPSRSSMPFLAILKRIVQSPKKQHGEKPPIQPCDSASASSTLEQKSYGYRLPCYYFYCSSLPSVRPFVSDCGRLQSSHLTDTSQCSFRQSA